MSSFQIYPALDLKDGNCVRLIHGKENKMTVYEDNPVKQVEFFSKYGFRWIHIVDLNAAFGKNDNKKIILQILKSFKKDIKVQLGGGIRSIEDIKFWIDAGVSRIVLGTFAFKNPDLINNLSDSFNKKLALGLDIKNKYVVASLKDNSIYFFELKSGSKVKNLERVNMGERIRDMIKVDSVLVLFLEDSASLAFVNLK